MLFEKKVYLIMIKKDKRGMEILVKSNSRLDVQSIFDLNYLHRRRNEELLFLWLRLNLGISSADFP